MLLTWQLRAILAAIRQFPRVRLTLVTATDTVLRLSSRNQIDSTLSGETVLLWQIMRRDSTNQELTMRASVMELPDISSILTDTPRVYDCEVSA